MLECWNDLYVQNADKREADGVPYLVRHTHKHMVTAKNRLKITSTAIYLLIFHIHRHKIN